MYQQVVSSNFRYIFKVLIYRFFGLLCKANILRTATLTQTSVNSSKYIIQGFFQIGFTYLTFIMIYDFIIEHSKNEKLQKYRIILSRILFTQKICPLKLSHVYYCHLYFFCKIPKYIQTQSNILFHSMGWYAWIAIMWKWVK